MNHAVALACQPEIVKIPIQQILPLKILNRALTSSTKYQRIASSIKEIGIIEPPIVYPHHETKGHYLLLDGHLRLHVVQETGASTIECLIANDDEAFTYNHKVNRLAPIQEHFMILRAIKNGVPEKRIAKALSLDVASIRKKRDLLDGICPEAVELLKERPIPAVTLRELRRAKPIRQIEMVELMTASKNYSVSYAKCLITMTPNEQLIDAEKSRDVDGLNPEELARIEREMETLEKDFLAIEESHGKTMLNFVVVTGYLKSLHENPRVSRYLQQHYSEIHSELQNLIEIRKSGGTINDVA